jgi:membrane-bound lytic murein transglycosylase F
MAICLILAGCQERIAPADESGDSQPLLPHPIVDRDLDDIRRGGVIRMITRYNSTSYFIHKGGQSGFDYELLWRFARLNDLTVEVVVPDPGENMLALLNEGRGDVVAAGLAADEETARWAVWTRPTNFVQKVLVVSDQQPVPETMAGLAGMTVVLPIGDSFRDDLQSLRDDHRIRFFLSEARPGEQPEDILGRISQGELQATVVDDVLARSALTYLPNLQIGPALGERRSTAWMLRENSPDLRAALNMYLKDNLVVTEGGRTRRSTDYGTIYDRYFRDESAIMDFQEPDHRPDMSGVLSAYDDLIRPKSEEVGLDWRMVAALIYQESEFYPQARSVADARGLMQILPRFAGAQADSLFQPEPNLTAGLRLLKALHGHYAYLDSIDRWRFTLAEYHEGYGHLTDARLLAMEMGRDPNDWEHGMVKALPMLRIRRHYSKTKYGFYDGAETVDYVEEILNRFNMYRRLVARYPDTNEESGFDQATMPDLPDLRRQPPPPR